MTAPDSPPSPPAAAVDEAFFARARREAQRYGEDPWVFLRELVQNARDAQADTISFTTRVEARDGAAVEQVRCDDNGTGMSRDDVERFLLRLYASSKGVAGAPSSKGPHSEKAGRFGVGFWSVLRFDPDTVVVETHDGTAATALVIDVRQHTLREVAATRTTAGTRVTLQRTRPPSTDSDDTLQQQVRRALRKSCGPVQGVGGRPPPRLLVDDAPVNRALSAGGSFVTRITGDGFRGEVGLGSAPVVEIYAHGLLVREASSLDELQPAKRPRERARVPGLFPRVVVDAPGLTVLLDRQGVVEDEALDRLMNACAFALEHLEVQALDAAAPLSAGDAAVFWLSRFLKRQLTLRPKRAGVVAAVAAAVVALAGGTALGNLTSNLIEEARPPAAVAGDDPPTTTAPAADGATLVQDLVGDGFSARIDVASPAGAPARADLRYVGPDFLLFRTATLDRFSSTRGLVPAPKAPVASLADHRVIEDDGDRVSYVLSIATADVVRMPVPLGYVPTRVAVSGGGAQNALEPQLGRDGQALLLRPPAGILVVEATVGRLSPWPGAASRPAEPDLERVRDDVTWGPLVAQLRQLPPRERVEAARDAVAARLLYRTDPAAAGAFQGASGDWLERVSVVGGGDCDILNGLVVVLVRAAGTPAHLAIGLVGQSGQTAPDLHAWVEALVDDGWIALDATPVLARLVPASDDVIALPGAIEVRADAVARSWDGTGPAPGRPGSARGAGSVAGSVDGSADGDGSVGAAAAQRPARMRAALVAAAAASTLLALFLGVLGLRALLRRRARDRNDDDVKRDAARLAPWFAAQLRAGRGTDPLGLWRRPYVPTRGGRLLSLQQVEERTARSLLLGAHAQTPLPPGVGDDDVIALDDPRAQALLPSLPGLLDLATLGPLDDASRAPLPAPLGDLEQRLRRLDPGVRLHARPGVALREARLPVRGDGTATGARHLFVGVDAPGVREALALEDEALRRFRLARAVCAGTTALRRHEPQLLAALAAEALTDAALNPRSEP